VLEVEVRPQHEITDAEGVVVARVDLWVCGTTSAHEYDGSDHRLPAQHVKDLRRDRRLDGVHVTRRGYTAGDVLHRPVTVLRDADRAVGRAHDPSRVRAWHDLLKDSLFTPAGQVAFLTRIATATRVTGAQA
jgi:hypothetical protein